ncbi:hypothetical protein AYK24_06585 [Thermoplasmatales archaeon SG8-52-4]|nr:MAG: hypothetical protein AYK24_06585 [Thermoplasmatales archaeon SG8-52-4]
MKIAITMYMINNLGGIVNHLENCAHGFRELGHTVHYYILTPKKAPTKNPDISGLKRKDGWTQGAFGIFHQYNGWRLDKKWYLSYKDEELAKRSADVLSKYDMILWEMPVPRKNVENKGNPHWLHLYGSCDKNVSVFRDGHLFTYPHITAVLKYFDGFGCNHVCGYRIAKNIATPRALIFSPHDTSKKYKKKYNQRTPGFLSLQTFKGWKHVDDLIRAIPYMPAHLKKYVAGGGIEYAYMTSKDKCKPEYFARKKEDPDYIGKDGTERIFNRAMDYGMNWLGWIIEAKRDRILKSVRCLIDPSWNKSFAKHGDHFNRVTTDGMLQGCIPVARNLGVADNAKGEGVIFTPNKNYIMIPYNATPREFADIVDYANSLKPNEAHFIQHNNFRLLQHFDRVRVAQQYIDMANGKSTGFFGKLEKGSTNVKLITDGEKDLVEFFGKQRSKKGISSFIK